MELINSAEVFSGIMVDYCYVECSSASMQALVKYQKAFPNNPRALEINESVARGSDFFEEHPARGRLLVRLVGRVLHLRRLVRRPGPAGGRRVQAVAAHPARLPVARGDTEAGRRLGRKLPACVQKVYVEHERSQIINTAWALLALMAADFEDEAAIERGVRLLLSRQESDGDFPQEGISGVFNGNCMITYTNYRNLFIIWALGVFIQRRKAKQSE